MRVLQRKRTSRGVCVCIMRCIIRYWLPPLRRLKIPSVCGRHGEDSRELMCSSSPGPKVWESGELMVWVTAGNWAGARPKKSWYFSLESEGWKRPVTQLSSQTGGVSSLLLSLFVLFRSLINWIMPTSVRESSVLYTVYWFKCQSHPETPSQTHPK